MTRSMQKRAKLQLVADRGEQLQLLPGAVLERRQLEDPNDRALHPEYFAALHRRFGFTIDAAALPHNAKLPRFWTPADDALAQDWTGERVYCNPPFSNIAPWVLRARAGRADLVVMLLPADRTEQPWWQAWIEPFRDRPGTGLVVEFIGGRLRFLKPGQTAALRGERPAFGCCLCIWSSAG